MLAQHTHLHMKFDADKRGEFLFLTLLVSTDGTVNEIDFDEAFLSRSSTCDEEQLLEIRQGAAEALQSAGHMGAKVVILEVRFLDVGSPNWLFKQVAKVCVENALNNPNLTLTYTGRRRQVEAWLANNYIERD